MKLKDFWINTLTHVITFFILNIFFTNNTQILLFLWQLELIANNYIL